MHDFLQPLRPLSKKPQLLMGVDIDSTSIKGLVLNRCNGQFRVENYGMALLPPNAVSNDEIKDIEVVAATIKKLISSYCINVKNIALAVPDSAVITKVIQIGAHLKPNEIEEHVMVEAQRYIPYALEEVSLDFEIQRISENNSELLDVVLVISHIENIKRRVAAFADAGLRVCVVDVSSYVIERSCRLLVKQLSNQGINKIIAVIDVRIDAMVLTVLNDMKSVFTRSEAFDGRKLIEEVQHHYGLAISEASCIKKKSDLPESYVTDVLKPFKEALIDYMRRALHFFFAASQHEHVDQIILAGSITTIIPNLARYVTDQLGVAALVANPFIEMQLSSLIDAATFTNDAPNLLTCCGLALRSFTGMAVQGC